MLHMRHRLLLLFLLLLPLQWVWAGAAACRHEAGAAASQVQSWATGEAPANVPWTAGANAAAVALSFLDAAPVAAMPALPGWEFELYEEFEVVEQISPPDWSDVAIDTFSCRRAANEQLPSAPPPDPHEFDLPLCLVVVAPSLSDARACAVPLQPESAPVFRHDRPPSLTA